MIKKTKVLKRFQEDLRNGMNISEACTKHNVSLAYAMENMPKKLTKPRKKPKGRAPSTGEKYIQFRHGKYFLRKNVRRKMRCFGTYNTLEDAVKVRDYCMEHGWKVKSIDEYCRVLGVERSKETKKSERMFH